MAASGVLSSWLMLATNCDLVLARDLQLAALPSDLLEQAGVLDGDDGLVSERSISAIWLSLKGRTS